MLRNRLQLLRCALRGHRPRGTTVVLGNYGWSYSLWLNAQRCGCGAWIADYEKPFDPAPIRLGRDYSIEDVQRLIREQEQEQNDLDLPDPGKASI